MLLFLLALEHLRVTQRLLFLLHNIFPHFVITDKFGHFCILGQSYNYAILIIVHDSQMFIRKIKDYMMTLEREENGIKLMGNDFKRKG